jgi:hypothetical protein
MAETRLSWSCLGRVARPSRSDMWVCYSARRCSIMTPNGPFYFTGVCEPPLEAQLSRRPRSGRPRVRHAAANSSGAAGAGARAGLYDTRSGRSGSLSAPRPWRWHDRLRRGLQVNCDSAVGVSVYPVCKRERERESPPPLPTYPPTPLHLHFPSFTPSPPAHLLSLSYRGHLCTPSPFSPCTPPLSLL